VGSLVPTTDTRAIAMVAGDPCSFATRGSIWSRPSATVTKWLTLLTGFGAELPLGVFFFWLYRRIAMTTMSVLHHDTSEVPRPRRLRDFKIVS